MKFFYIANDNFSDAGHPFPTLRGLCHNGVDQVILLSQPQEDSFRKNLPERCSLVEFLPTSEMGRYVAPPVLGASIAEKLLEYGVDSHDLILLRMPFPYLLLSVIYALVLSKVSLVVPRLTVLISQTDEGYPGEDIKTSDCLEVINRLPRIFRDRIALVHEREVLLQHWQEQFPLLRMGLCGYVSEWVQKSKPADNGGYSLVYLGEARAEKGFSALADLLTTEKIDCGVLVHCDANANNVTGAYEATLRRLEDCSRRSPRVRLVAQIRENSYEAAFGPGFVALMLYSPEYRLRGSGVLQECVAAGMFVIAYDDLGFQMDFPQNVLTVSRQSDPAALASAVQTWMDQIIAGKRATPQPIALTAASFRELLQRPHLPPPAQRGQFVFVVSNNVHRQGCSKIIEAQEEEILTSGLTPVYISFEWPDLGIDWSEQVAFQRIWRMQMNSPKSSYGYHFLTLALITKSRILEQYDSLQYKELVEISADVDNRMLDTYLGWRKEPVLVVNYLHHTPIIEGKIPNFEQTFLEIHDICTFQQRIRANDSDEERFQENLSLEIAHLDRFKHKVALSPNEVDLLVERGGSICEHSYLDVFIRKAAERSNATTKTKDARIVEGEYLCIVGSDHPSNVAEINRFCAMESDNPDRSLPVVVCGIVCSKITVSRETLERANIHLAGFVEDVALVIREAIATLNPVDLGSGTPIKVLDSIANGTPCLATKRTVVAMQPHPLVVEFDFTKRRIKDSEIRDLASNARKRFTDSFDADLITPNKLREFLDGYRSSQFGSDDRRHVT